MASRTRVAKYPYQLVIMASAETGEIIDRLAEEHGESKAEVARTFLDAGIAAGQSSAIEDAAELLS